MSMFRRISTIAVVAFACGSISPASAGPTDFGPKAKVGHVQGVQLRPSQKSHYQQFRKQKNYFGAFYINTELDKSFSVRGFHDLAIARRAALKGCEEVSKGQGTCQAYGEVLPANMPFDQRQAAGMGQKTREVFLGEYPDKQTQTGFGAFAISGAYNYGLSYNWENAEEAREAALGYCNSGVAKAMAGLNIASRDWARRNGLTSCRIVDLYHP